MEFLSAEELNITERERAALVLILSKLLGEEMTAEHISFSYCEDNPEAKSLAEMVAACLDLSMEEYDSWSCTDELADLLSPDPSAVDEEGYVIDEVDPSSPILANTSQIMLAISNYLATGHAEWRSIMELSARQL